MRRYDTALRPVNLSGENLALVGLVTYNAAGAVTGFTRQDTQAGAVTNTYNWGLTFAYDEFGNKTQQTASKGNPPPHSLSIDGSTNRINMTGFTYDANGNMTAMPNAGAPATTMAYDIANRMVETVHQTAGAYRFGYNHANQRVFQYTNTTAFGTRNRRFSLYGFAGELLLEANRTESGVQPHTGEVVRYVYFLGRKMFASVNRGPLKAAVPNRLGSRSDHFPYGEQKGAAPPDGDKDHFTTYRRDANGLDYAWNRYYAPSVGRFTSPDLDARSINLQNPQSWNRYTYVSSNPINAIDPTGNVEQHMGGYWGCGDWIDPLEFERPRWTSETNPFPCPPWTRPDPGYGQQRVIPHSVEPVSLGVDGMYFIMHQTQGGAVPVFTIEAVLVQGGRITLTVIGGSTAVASGIVVGGTLLYYYWDDIVRALRYLEAERFAQEMCPKGDKFWNPNVPPHDGPWERLKNSRGNPY